MSKQELFNKWRNYLQSAEENGQRGLFTDSQETLAAEEYAAQKERTLTEAEQQKLQSFVEKIQGLDIQEEVLLRMRYEDKMSIQDIQEFFGYSISVVKMYLHRTSLKVKQQ